MRGYVLAVLAVLGLASGCNQLLGIEDPPADPCTGTCACQIDADCGGAREYCNDQVTLRTCDCVAGYQRGAAGCEWLGVVSDRGFAGTTAWTASNQASVDGALVDPAMVDPGALRLPNNSCSAQVIQQVVMPRYSRAGPLVAMMSYRIVEFGNGDAGPAFGLGPAWNDTMRGGIAWQTVRVCLGAGQYASEATTGRGVERALRIAQREGSQCTGAAIDVDRFEIVPAGSGECPAPGEVTNGNAETDTGWVFSATPPATAAYASAIGDGATRAVRLFSPKRCDPATAAVPMSIPLADPTGTAALSFYARASTGSVVVPRLLQQAMSTFPGAVQPTMARACVPAPLRGAASQLVLGTDHSGPCPEVVNHEAIFDTVELRNDPRCGDDPAIADPGFESGYQPFGAEARLNGQAVAIVDASQAHSGSGVAHLSTTSCGSHAALETLVVTPPATTGAGPALAYWYRATTGTNTLFQVTSNAGTTAQMRDGQWRPGRQCLAPRLAGRSQRVYFFLGDATGCTGTFSDGVFIDDLAVTTDSSCPTL